MNFGPVTPEFNIRKDVHPVVSFLKINFSDKLSQDPPDRLLPNVHRMVGIRSKITDLTLFFRSLKGCCHGNQF